MIHHISNGTSVPIRANIVAPVYTSVMSRESTLLRSLEAWIGIVFLVGGVMFVASAAITVVDIVAGAEQLRLQLGQATVGFGWIAGLVGLLGLYPGLADRNPWLIRVGAVFVAIGLVGYLILTIGVLAIFAGLPEGDLDPLLPVFLPLMLAGSVLTFPLFGVASLRSDVHSRTVGLLLLCPTLLFAVNVLTPTTPTPASLALVLVSGLALVHLAIGYLLQTGRGMVVRDELGSSQDPNVG